MTSKKSAKDKRAVLPEWVDHALSGNQWKNCRELHVGGDFLLIYRIESLSKFDMVVFVRTGTHSELFK